ncbi:MFS transporter [Kineosporia rhizophila]|uniref:MFS transporter n=1 Tax=Kineosporia TaxID=49184 RepID=UPI001E3838CD|nr:MULTISPECIES: MFS transporter [Kineosporia]MCE0536513.1 MFS transporter [Kineosporia rhizophila]
MSGNTRADHRGAAVAVVCAAQFAVVLDVTIVTTALPAIGADLGFSPAALPWVSTAYALVLGGLLVPGGRVADLLGPRRLFGLGTALFALASVACALAWSPAVLIAARIVQGIGSALLSPAALSLLTQVSGPGAARRRAVGWWTAAAAGGGASGWVLGGVLTEYLGWRAVFGAVAAVAAVVLLGLGRVPAGSRVRDRALDAPGAVLIATGLGLLGWGLAQTGEHGPLHLTAGAPVLAGTAVLALFARHLRRAKDPLIPPGLLRSPGTAGANLTAVALTASTSPAMFLATLYVQRVLGLSPGQAALLFPVFNVAVIAGSLGGPPLVLRLGARLTALAGFAALAAGTAGATALPGGGRPIVPVLLVFALMGVGLGVASVASTHTGTEAADPKTRGAASGVLNSTAQLGTALGLAVLTPLAVSAPAGSMTGYRLGFAGTLLITLAGAAACLLIPARSAPAPVAATGGTISSGRRW